MNRALVLTAVLTALSLAALGPLSRPAPASVLEVWADGHGEYPDIRSAMTVAQPGDTVLLGDGEYTGPDNHNIDYLGRSIVIRSRSDRPDLCRINCRLTRDDVAERGFLFQSGEDSAAVLRGVTVENAVTLGHYCAPIGAGVFCHNGASPRIENCIFRDNVAEEGAGAAASTSTAPVFRDCVFENNIATVTGGALYVGSYAHPSLYRCRFVNNQGTYGGGAVVAWTGNSAYFRDCEFTGNFGDCGGCIDGEGGIPTFHYCVFRGNTAGTQGGIFQTERDGNLKLLHCTFLENSANFGGIGYIRGRALVVSCTLYNNSSWNALFYMESGQLWIDHTIISHTTRGSEVLCTGEATASVSCSDFHDSNWGEWMWCVADQFDGVHNVSIDPFFCRPDEDDLHLQPFSWCAPGNNPGCGLIGSWPEGCTTGVDAPVPAGTALAVSVSPNPGRGDFRLEWSAAVGRAVSVQVFDVNGRRVRAFHGLPAVTNGITWDGLDGAGRALPSGVYQVRVADERTSADVRLVLIQ